MWQWEVKGVAVREGGEMDIQLDKSTHNQWLVGLAKWRQYFVS